MPGHPWGWVFAVAYKSRGSTTERGGQLPTSGPTLPLHRLLDEVPVGIFTADRHGRTTWVNRHWCNLAGVASSRAIDLDWLSAIHPDDRQAVHDGWEGALRTGRPSGGDYRFLHPDGKVVHVHGRADPELDEDGNVTGWIGTITDVSARIAAESLMSIQRDVLEMVVSGAPVQVTLDHLLRFVEAQEPDLLASILILDDDRRRLFPLAAPSLPASYSNEIAGTEIGPDAGSCGTAAWLGGEVIVDDITTDPRWARFKHIAAKYDLRACWSTPVFDRDGLVLGTFAMYFREPRFPTDKHRRLIRLITDLAALAITRDRDLKTLRDSEQEFRGIFDQVALGVALLDRDARYLRVNQRFAEIAGVAVEEIIGQQLGMLAQAEASDRNKDMVEALIRGEIDVHRGEHRLHRRDGSIIWTTLAATSVRDDQGNVNRVIMVVEDVTAARKLEEQLRQSQKLEAIGMLAGGVAHDFNNLLSVILGHAEMATHTIEPDHPVRADLEAITDASRHGAAVTKQLLAFARRELTPPRPTDLNQRIAEMERMLARLIRADIVLETRLGNGLWPVLIDPTQFDQALINLITNARDAIDGTGTITITTGNVPGDKPMVAVRVRDTGSGMSDDTRAKILQPFFTTKARGLGTGLGLPVVVGIIEQAGGVVQIESEPGRGSEFTLMLPRTHLDVTDTGEHGGIASIARSAPDATVMLVEDEAPLLHLQRRTLERAGFRVLVAGSGQQALDLLEEFQERIDLLLTDVVMPGMGGVELASKVTKSRPGTRVLYMSGYPADVVTARGDLPSESAYLQKPFTATELLKQVTELLGR